MSSTFSEQTNVPETVPMVLVLSSETMNNPVAPTTTTPRSFIVQEGLRIASQHFASSGTPEARLSTGLRTFAFTNNQVADLGNLNEYNVRDQVKQITWDGTPKVGPGLRRIAQVYHNDFGNSTSPRLEATIITDTVAEDVNWLTQEISRDETNVSMDITIAVVGFGTSYTDALNVYKKVAQENPNVHVVDLGEMTKPETVAEKLVETLT